ncbi:MobC family plasmid mobilization relaxosome protein [Apilactobacillus sp. M161]|uniref:MobC family plasmid mobilization relaxosome protein n=1 Tax=Apilactobacillus xinyiensis TaxID=2841032 RepID=A0ABT0I390_9LACO|nr:plasmid mobilization relaxosome protein MobC [Apilactobacillus xinyiensis]MCK8625210.1 MobC family plasmid mobilization relaxosome protein [Apilactobacillus xinyiensis]
MVRKQVNISLNDAEFETLNFLALEHNSKRSTVLKSLINHQKLKEPKIMPNQALAINHQLKKMGNNLNQLTKIAHQNGQLEQLDTLQKMRDELSQICQQLK